MCCPQFLDTPRSSVEMDRPPQDPGCEDSSSLPVRSRAGTASSDQFATYTFVESPRSLLNEPSPSIAPQELSPSYICGLSQDPITYLPTPVSRAYSPFPVLSPELLSGEWHEQGNLSNSAPLVRVEPEQDYSPNPSPSLLPGGDAATMR
jgi:hypothetical protein